jgi:Spy/CpxP family protein refolding chaperone
VQTFELGVSMDARRTGIAMVVVGGAALTGSIIADTIRYESDDTLVNREGIFDLSIFSHVVFFAGLCVVALGAITLAVGPWLLNNRRNRLVPVLAGVFALAIVAGCAAAANSSDYAEPAGDHHADDSTGGATGAGDHHADEAADEGADEGTDHHAEGAMDHDVEGMDHGTDADAAVAPGAVIPGTADGTSPCEIAQPAPVSPGQVGSGEGGQEGSDAGEHGHRGMVKQYELTAEERVQLQAEMALSRTVVDQFPTVADAEAAGYKRSTPYVPCIGAHYTNVSRVVRFDPAAPSELLYDGTDPDSLLVGLSYLVLDTTGAPAGFAGENDIWHQHNANGGLCLNPNLEVIGGEDMSEEDCTARGGTKGGGIMENIWMMHAWVVPGWECSWGVFSGECPELGGTLGGTAHD